MAICRKRAAEARMRFRPKPTPRSEVRAMRVQATEQQDIAEELERLMEQESKPVDKEVKAKDKPKTKPMAKPKPKKTASSVKKQKPKIEKPKQEVNYGEHGHDFNSEE